MLHWKTTLALLLLTVGVGAYVSLYELKRPSPGDQERLSKQILNPDEQALTQIALEVPKAKLILAQERGLWTLSPEGVRANKEAVDRLLASLSPLMAERTLSESDERPLPLADYGLEPPLGRIDLFAKTSATMLFIGEATPVGGNRYVKRADRSGVDIVSSAFFEAANQPREAFRDPLLLRLNSWLVDGLTIASASASFSLEQRESEWHLSFLPLQTEPGARAQPLSDRADRTEVNALLARLGGVRIERFIDDNPAVEQLSDWGLDQPLAEITLRRREDQPSTLRLFFGRSLPDEASLVYAKRSDEPSLYAVSEASLTPLLVDPQGLRSKACFNFFTSQVTKVSLSGKENGWTIERADGSPGPEQAQWKESSSGTLLDTQRVEEWLNTLSDMRIAGFVEDAPMDWAGYGLEPPAGVITISTSASEAPQQLSVGSLIEGSTDRYGRIEGRLSVVRLRDSISETLATRIDRFFSGPPATQTASSATSALSSAQAPNAAPNR